MEKKYLIVGMAVILGASLSFFACDDSTKEAAEPTPAEKAAAALVETLGEGVEVDGATVTLTADVTLTANADVAAGVTLAVPIGKALNVPAGKAVTVEDGGKLDVTGTMTVGGSSPATSVRAALAVRQEVLADTAASGGSLTVENGGTLAITGTVTGATGGQIVLGATAIVTGGTFYTAGETAGNAETGTTYNWAADAGGTGAAGWQEAFTVTTTSYSLKKTSASDAAADNSGLTIAYARKATASGKTYIKLGGTIAAAHQLVSSEGSVTTSNFDNWDSGEWGQGPGGNYVPAAGKYKSVALNGLFPQAKSNVAIKNSNFAFHYYDGTGSYNFLTTTAPTEPQIRENSGGTALDSPPPDVYLPADLTTKPFKWKLYSGSHFAANETFSLLIWSEAPDKTVTLDIDQYAAFEVSGTPTRLATVVIDYSGVNWGT
jgi:hypothetical protein